MNDMIKGLLGKKLDISTNDEFYSECELKQVCDDWILVDEAGDLKYLNLRYVREIELTPEDEEPGKIGLFRRKKDREEF